MQIHVMAYMQCYTQCQCLLTVLTFYVWKEGWHKKKTIIICKIKIEWPTLTVSVTIAYCCLCLVNQRGRCTYSGHLSLSHPIFLQRNHFWLRKQGLLSAIGMLRGLRQDAQPLISELEMWVISQLQIIFSWKHCLLIKDSKDNRGLQPFCICKQFCVRALITSTSVSLLILVCYWSLHTNIQVAVSLHTFPLFTCSFFIFRNCLSNVFLYNPYPQVLCQENVRKNCWQ